MSLWLPEDVQRELNDQRAADDTEANLLVQHDIKAAKHITRELQRIDPYLELVYVGRPPGWTPGVDPPAGIVFERWHLRRNNPEAADTYEAWTTPDGGYREPDSGVFEWLAENDLWDGRVQERRMRRQAKREAERQRASDRRREELRQEFAERLKAKENPGVSMTSAGPWSYRAGARRG